MNLVFENWLNIQHQNAVLIEQLSLLIEQKENLLETARLTYSLFLMIKEDMMLWKQVLIDVQQIQDEVDVDDQLDQRLARLAQINTQNLQKNQLLLDKLAQLRKISWWGYWRIWWHLYQTKKLHLETDKIIEHIRVYIREHDADHSSVVGHFDNADDLIHFLKN